MKKIILKILCLTFLATFVANTHGMNQPSDLSTRLSDDHIGETFKRSLLTIANGIHYGLRGSAIICLKVAKGALHGARILVALPGKVVRGTFRGVVHGTRALASLPGKAARQTITFAKQNPKKSIVLGALGAWLFARSRFARNAARATKLLFANRLLRSNNRRLIEWALRLGANINHRFTDNKNALHIAAEEGNADIVDYLILQGANIGATDWLGKTPIHYAAQNGHIAIVDRLVRAGEDINVATMGNLSSPLHLAAAHAQLPMVRWLVQHGANALQLDVVGRTPRQATERDYHIAPLYLHYHPEDIRHYLDQIPPAREGHWFTRMLHNAIDDRDVQAARVAINSGASLADAIPEHIPLLRTIGEHNRHVATPLDDIADALVQAGAPIRIADANGDTPLHYAVTHNNARLAGLFLDHGADVRAQNNHHEVPLDIALRNHDRPMVHLLRERGARWTAEQLAANLWAVEGPAAEAVAPVAAQ